MTEISIAFIAGLAGSAHCLGMCGGIVAALSLNDKSVSRRSRFLSQIWYNLGRVSTYSLLGVTAGMLGTSLNLLAVKSLSLWIFCAANLLVIALGIGSACKVPIFNLSSLEKCAGRMFERMKVSPLSGAAPLASFPLGLLLGFLPCGLVYGPLLVAVGSGPLLGGAIMIAIGAGTMPVLLLAGSASTVMPNSMRDRIFRLAGLAVALMGMVGLWRVFGNMGHLPPFSF